MQHLKVGDRVTGFTYAYFIPVVHETDTERKFSYGANQTNNGAFADYLRLDSYVAMKLPDGMTYEEAASFPVRSFPNLLVCIPC